MKEITDESDDIHHHRAETEKESYLMKHKRGDIRQSAGRLGQTWVLDMLQIEIREIRDSTKERLFRRGDERHDPSSD